MKYQRIPYDDFMAIYHKVPRAAVDLVIYTKEGVLLTKRAIPPYKGMWHIPGGTILFNEPVKHTIDRIGKDELGIKVKIKKLLGIIEYFEEDGRHTVSYAHQVEIVSGRLSGSEQGEEIKFFSKVPRNCIPAQKKFLRVLTAKTEVSSYHTRRVSS